MQGMENAKIVRPGYAIEYDFFDPTTTENFNYLESNNMTMEIVPSEIPNYSIIKIKNEMKNKFTVSALTNNYGEDKQNAIWRGIKITKLPPSMPAKTWKVSASVKLLWTKQLPQY